MLFGVGDIGATEVAAYTLVAISSIYHHHIRILLQKLAHHTIHVEALAAATGSDTEEISIVSVLVYSFLAGNVYRHRKSLPVCIVGFERRLLRVFQMLLKA